MILLVAIADLHIGSTVALSPPQVTRDDKGAYTHNPAVAWLWAGWLEMWQEIAFQADQHKAEVYLVLNGDLFEGIHHQTTQLWSHNPADWFRAATETLAPAADTAHHIWFTRGTPAHDHLPSPLCPSLPLFPKPCYNLEHNQRSPRYQHRLGLTDMRGGEATSTDTHLLQCGSHPACLTHR